MRVESGVAALDGDHETSTGIPWRPSRSAEHNSNPIQYPPGSPVPSPWRRALFPVEVVVPDLGRAVEGCAVAAAVYHGPFKCVVVILVILLCSDSSELITA